MQHKVKVSLEIGDSGKVRMIEATFEEEEWDAFLRFVDYAKDLQTIQLFCEGGPAKLDLTYRKDVGASFTAELPPEDQIIVLLHRLRPFILNDEQTNFLRICNHLARRIEDEDFRNFVKILREGYLGKCMQNMVIIRSNDAIINSEQTLMKWLNAHEYHKDSNKQAELESMHQILPLETSRAIFIMLIYEKVKAISIVGNLINVIIGGQESFKCKIK